MRFKPAAFSSAACSARREPLVVIARSSAPSQLREPGDDLDDVAPQQRLAARQPQLLDAELQEHARPRA